MRGKHLHLRLFLFGLVLAVPSAAAWTMGEGVEIEQNGFITTRVAEDIEVTTTAYFEGEAFHISPFSWEWTEPDGTQSWDLYWNAPQNVTFNATSPTATSDQARITFEGFQGLYGVTGMQGYPTFQVTGPDFELVAPALTEGFSIYLLAVIDLTELSEMTTFFGHPFMQTLPYLIGLVAGVFIIPRSRGFLQAVMIVIGALVALFAVALSYAELEGIATYTAIPLSMAYVGLVFYAVWHVFSESANPSPH